MQGGDNWGISAPESYVLLHGPKGGLEPEGEAFRLAILELSARGWISRREGGESEGGAEALDSRLVRGDADFAPRDRPLVAALSVYEGALSEAGDPGEGVPAEYAFAAGRERYGDFSAYIEEDVLPSLQERGYYEYADDRILGIIPRKRWRETEAGKRVREDLERNMEKARELPDLARKEPDSARSFLDGVGPLVLLMPFIYPDIAELGEGSFSGGEGGALDPSSFEGLSGLSESLEGAMPGGPGDQFGSGGAEDTREGGGAFGDGGLFGGNGGGLGGGGDAGGGV